MSCGAVPLPQFIVTLLTGLANSMRCTVAFRGLDAVRQAKFLDGLKVGALPALESLMAIHCALAFVLKLMTAKVNKHIFSSLGVPSYIFLILTLEA